jgi:ribonucleoside-diphosphate reductase alpha chain
MNITFDIKDTDYIVSHPPIPEWLNEEGLKTLQRGYLLPGETPRDLYYRVASQACRYLNRPDLIRDFFDILWLGFLGLATPVASNFGTNRGLPISCYAHSISDSVPSIYSHLKEVAMMSKNGGGVGTYLGNIRPSGAPISGGGVSTGIVPVAQQYDKCARYISQGNIRRGSFAMYLPIDHPDAYELLLAKDHLEGDPRQMIDANIAFTITDDFMHKVMKGDEKAKKVWAKALEMNLKVGSPYFIFIDNVNARNPQAYINHGLKVETSNLCAEILLYTDENHSFVCCLSSLNLFKWDEWKDWHGMNSGKTVVELSIYLLDAVMEEFIKRAASLPGMGRAVRSAQKGRPLGLGAQGLHYLYQKKMLPFKSKEARELNIEIFKTINELSLKASQDMAKEYGEPEWCEGTGLRHTHRIAVAPTRTNSVISGAFSPGIEPIDSNSYTAKQAKGSFIRKNGLLKDLLISKGLDTYEVWDQILHDNGSVMNIDGLTIEEKLVFLTAREIDPEELVRQACDRTEFICQGQSLNRYVHPDIPIKKFNDLVFKAWAGGTKSTYYTKSSSEKVIAKVANQAHIITKEDCPYCEKAKLLFTKLGIKYTEYKREDVTHFTWKTVPQIWLEGHYIGGYDDLLEFLSVKKQKIFEREVIYKEEVKSFKDVLEKIGEGDEECLSCQG